MASRTAEAGIGTLGAVILAITATALLTRGKRSAPAALRAGPRPQIADRKQAEEDAIRHPTLPSPAARQRATVAAARQVSRAAGMLAVSVLLDSAVEHYRGSFQNKAMYTPLVVSLLTLAASAHGATAGRPGSHRARNAGYALAAMSGLVGTGFHIYNIAKRPGRFSWINLFYSAPLGAPAALSLAWRPLTCWRTAPMPDRYPGYDVLNKRRTQSWNEQTRRVIDARLAMPRAPRFFQPDEWQTLGAVCDRIVPQPKDRTPVPLAAMVDTKMYEDQGDGYRDARLPKMQEAWRRGLKALDEEARAGHGRRFHELAAAAQDSLLSKMQKGELSSAAWGDMPGKIFFNERLVHDIIGAYYAHPTSWNEIGFGGPASPRGYVRMNFDRRDPWEASEARPGREAAARRENERAG